ncbi:hypothetical protein PR048_005774 [Dryococelus australis]|uniref:Uncharacterized protein n=1 Tax=Dryococelus australis TaxID=614101 RepID=A0ABQ9I952_9NEOP|nr:hypothetical protein PR048_005774 [Dryococelus australis]
MQDTLTLRIKQCKTDTECNELIACSDTCSGENLNDDMAAVFSLAMSYNHDCCSNHALNEKAKLTKCVPIVATRTLVSDSYAIIDFVVIYTGEITNVKCSFICYNARGASNLMQPIAFVLITHLNLLRGRHSYTGLYTAVLAEIPCERNHISLSVQVIGAEHLHNAPDIWQLNPMDGVFCHRGIGPRVTPRNFYEQTRVMEHAVSEASVTGLLNVVTSEVTAFLAEVQPPVLPPVTLSDMTLLLAESSERYEIFWTPLLNAQQHFKGTVRQRAASRCYGIDIYNKHEKGGGGAINERSPKKAAEQRSGTIPTRGHQAATPPGIEPGSPSVHFTSPLCDLRLVSSATNLSTKPKMQEVKIGEMLRYSKVIEVNMERRWDEGGGKRKIPEKTHRPTASSGTIPTCENPQETFKFLCARYLSVRDQWYEIFRLSRFAMLKEVRNLSTIMLPPAAVVPFSMRKAIITLVIGCNVVLPRGIRWCGWGLKTSHVQVEIYDDIQIERKQVLAAGGRTCGEGRGVDWK